MEIVRFFGRAFARPETAESVKDPPSPGEVINIEEELRLLEEKANEAYGAYQEALDVTAKLQEENKDLEKERDNLTKQLEAEQGNLSQYQERQAKAAAQKADLETFVILSCSKKLYKALYTFLFRYI